MAFVDNPISEEAYEFLKADEKQERPWEAYRQLKLAAEEIDRLEDYITELCMDEDL